MSEKQNKHQHYELKQMQSLPLKAKVIMTQQRIRDWYNYWDGNVYVSFSGGKDSTVLVDLVQKTSGVYDVPVVFVDTGLEYPEVRKFARERADVVLKPKLRFDEVLTKYVYPIISKEISQKVKDGKMAIEKGYEDSYALRQFNGLYMTKDGKKSIFNIKKWRFLLDSDFRISASCCDVMKKRPAHMFSKETGLKPYIGTMAYESELRKRKWIENGCNAYQTKEPVSNPMSFWLETDVLQYIKENDLEYASVYGDIVKDENGDYKTTGCERTGCMFCMFGCHLEKEPNRFQRLKETHPKQYQYCIGGGSMMRMAFGPRIKKGSGLLMYSTI